MYSLTNRVGLLSTMPIVGFDENKGHKKTERQYRYARAKLNTSYLMSEYMCSCGLFVDEWCTSISYIIKKTLLLGFFAGIMRF